MSGDEFEGKYMHDGARVVHRDKQVSRAFAALVSIPALAFFLSGIMFAIGNAYAPRPMPGLWGPDIPIEAITSTRVIQAPFRLPALLAESSSSSTEEEERRAEK